MSCDACYCDYDPATVPTVHRVSLQKARKPHVCIECGAIIRAGDEYEYMFGIWDGYKSTGHTCLLCRELREWAIISVPCFCWYYGDLHQDVWDMVDEVKHDVRGFVFEWGRRMIRIRRQKKERLAA